MIKKNNQKSFAIIIIGLIFSFNFTGCSTYQKHLGGTGHNYENAQDAPTLHSTNTKFPLVKSKRYSIPSIPKTKTTGKVDVSPPDDANTPESEKLELEKSESEKIKN